jgi:hypothetical protein
VAQLSVVVLTTTTLAVGCGGGDKLDEGQFSAKDRQAARVILGLLAHTSVWQAAARMTLTESASPVCVIHLESADPLRFKLFMTWIPGPIEQQTIFAGVPRAYVWLQAVLGPKDQKRDYSLHLGNELTLAGLKAHYGDAFSFPVERCQLLVNGTFRLLSSAD